ncbi:HlyD family efflux transporter periplasmic adaptor subunit [Larkinella rosea]|uniref:HlyD family efflux transporter periplasmic adaptor subunit n=1 Tax=Larkinella rosea TaxID=2025312 RepID=A0A3P1BTX9_9BACT|nr:HlyD family efflux transporter periplasmic adaptor subunit [Larkinella rosea]RRB04561.1 HlyD family efflux transporter periplasmic adaptor subunit [Larkinella rosea]
MVNTSLIGHELLVYLPRVTVRSQLLYTAVLFAITAAIAALPFIYVDVSVQASGLIRPVAERSEVKTTTGGTVAVLWIRENQVVRAGQPLMRLQTEILDTKLRLVTAQQAEKRMYIRDLQQLTRLTDTQLVSATGLISPLYRQQYEQFRYLAQENLQTQQKRQRELDVNRQLYVDKVIPRLELEDKEFVYKTVVAQYRTLVERQRSEWQTALSEHRLALTDLMGQERQLKQEQAFSTIKAPVGGTISQLSGRYVGSFVQAGEIVGTISPDSTLIIECYATPKDIGLLQIGQKAHFQIAAFNYNQWGLLEGLILDVANDFILVENQPVFKVRCRLNRNFLTLKNGYRGYLKKGMTVQARFIVTRRSLFELLYDKADDWLNPVNQPVASRLR